MLSLGVNQFAQALHKHRPVRQSGQGVAVGKPAQLRFTQLTLGNVGEHRNILRYLALLIFNLVEGQFSLVYLAIVSLLFYFVMPAAVLGKCLANVMHQAAGVKR